jgi:hypothetical protein
MLPETVLQPSLHTISEYVDLVLSEAESRDIDIADLRAEFDADPEGEFIGELADDALSRLSDGGFANIEAEDTLLIMPKDASLPAYWRD